MRTHLVLVAIGAALVVSLGLGAIILTTEPGPRTFALEAREFSYSGLGYEGATGGPTIQVKVGETIRIDIKNTGALEHELMIVSEEDLERALKAKEEHEEAAHEEEHFHPEPAFEGAKVHDLRPGEIKSMVFVADKPGVYYYACFEEYPESHIHLGMYGKLVVLPS